jgi:predicted ATPase
VAAIRTPDHRIRVFVSSTLGELAPERAAVRDAIERLHLTPVLFEAGARPHPPRALYRAYLDQSDVFVAIYWERYGWVAPGEEVSGLEDEYRLASGRLPQLVYIKEPSPSRDENLAGLLERIQHDDRLAYRRFTNVDELAALVSDDLAVLLSERFHSDSDGRERLRTVRPPVPLDRTLGREVDVDRIVEIVRSGARLVTLTGVGGIGKSRLALEVAHALSNEFPGGAVFVALDSLADSSLVLPTIARRLGVQGDGRDELLDALIADLTSEPKLLLLDNFEHVAVAAADVAAILDACPRAVAIVTSRHVLRVHGEWEYQVSPLEQSAAVSLFVERAGSARPGFTLNDANRAAVVEICEHLDRLPLAIELAAVCIRLFPPEALLAALSTRMDLLSRGATDRPERQRTLRATMDWGYDLLNESERVLFARLAVFAAGWTLEAAEAVCGRAGEPDVIETMAALLEKSLLVAMEAAGRQPRLRMLETIRAYAAEKLAQLPDREETECRHTAWIIGVLPQQFVAANATEWLGRMDCEQSDVRLAVRRALDHNDLATVVTLAQGTMSYLALHDAESEAASWLDEALAAAHEVEPALLARLLLTKALLAGTLGSYQRAEALLQEAIAADASVLDDSHNAAIAEMTNAVIASAVRSPQQALPIALQAARAMNAAHTPVGEAYMWLTAGTVALQADPANASTYLERALDLARSLGNEGLHGHALAMLGFSSRHEGNNDRARRLFLEGAQLSRRSSQRSSMLLAIEGLAAAAFDSGQPTVAAKGLGCAAAVRSTIARPAWASYQPVLDVLAEQIRTAIGDRDYELAREHGATWDAPEGLDQLLASLSALSSVS